VSDVRDPYEILQVSPSAEIEVIEAAYRRLARKYHPDTNPSPDATSKMKDLNWAYEVLGDTVSRRRYDLERRTPPAQPQTPPPQYAPAQRPRGSPPVTSHPPPPSPPVGRSFLQKHWLILALAVGGYLLVVQPQLRRSDSPSSPLSLGPATPTDDPYSDCIDWRAAGLYDGETMCILGRILIVEEEFDDLSGSDVWTAHFSFDPRSDFSLISVDHDISRWQGQCVAVYGSLLDRDTIRDYVQDPQPSMIASDPLDERGFTITSAPREKCG